MALALADILNKMAYFELGVGKTTYIVSARFPFFHRFFYCQPILT
jgi:hypothetical protein